VLQGKFHLTINFDLMINECLVHPKMLRFALDMVEIIVTFVHAY